MLAAEEERLQQALGSERKKIAFLESETENLKSQISAKENLLLDFKGQLSLSFTQWPFRHLRSPPKFVEASLHPFPPYDGSRLGPSTHNLSK